METPATRASISIDEFRKIELKVTTLSFAPNRPVVSQQVGRWR